MRHALTRHGYSAMLLVWALVGASGCVHTKEMVITPPPDGTVPRELCLETLPPYRIGPPDVLYVEVLLPPAKPERSEFSTALPPQPIQGNFLVRPDGSISIGVYGSVQVSGLTTDEARERVREFIAKVVERKPDTLQVTVDVAAYNSQVYYVITDGGGFGEQVYPFPVTGRETVLDALGRIGGVPAVGSKKDIWVARRSPRGGPDQILPVDWKGVAMEGSACTNYQVLPGDRVYVKAQCLISVDNAIAKVVSPVQRVLGVVLLGSSTVNNINGKFGNSGTGIR